MLTERNVFTTLDIDCIAHNWSKSCIPLDIIQQIEKYSDLNRYYYIINNNKYHSKCSRILYLFTLFVSLAFIVFHFECGTPQIESLVPYHKLTQSYHCMGPPTFMLYIPLEEFHGHITYWQFMGLYVVPEQPETFQ